MKKKFNSLLKSYKPLKMQFILQTLVLIWIIYLRDSNCVDSNIDSEWKSFKKTFKKAYQTEQQENERYSKKTLFNLYLLNVF